MRVTIFVFPFFLNGWIYDFYFLIVILANNQNFIACKWIYKKYKKNYIRDHFVIKVGQKAIIIEIHTLLLA